MMLYEPSLFVRKLLVIKDGKPVIRVEFHDGVNIISGPNGSGKSTVAEFLFYGLGGDTPRWKDEAAICDYVYCEIEINGELLTVRREISANIRQPMAIMWTGLAVAWEATPAAWEMYPFAATSKKESFSQVLFRALSIPEVKDELTNNRFTMHQLLRIIYADQVSGLMHLLKTEEWDPKELRQLIADVVFGLYDAEYYRAHARLLEAREELTVASARITASNELIIGPKGVPVPLATLQSEDAQLRAKQGQIEARLNKLIAAPENKIKQAELRAAIKEARDALREQNRMLSDAEDRVVRLEYEVGDSDLFITSLQKRLEALAGANAALASAGLAAFEQCPACTASLKERDDGSCGVCGNQLDEAAASANLLQLRNEIAQQVTESTQLQQRRRSELESIREQLPLLKQSRRNQQARYDRLTEDVSIGNDAAIGDAHREQGYIERQIEDLQRRITIAKRVEELKDHKAELQREIAALENVKRDRERKILQRRADAETAVGRWTATFLQKDLPRGEGFEHAKSISFSVRDNYLAVDGKAGFSASATILLKNAFHLGILFASLEQAYFRYPRIVLLDNIEDKGMEQVRSHNFQRVIAQMSAAATVRHQIIFSTSMIAPELHNDKFVVAEYETARKSVRFEGLTGSF